MTRSEPALNLRAVSRFQTLKGEGRIAWYEVEGLPVGERIKVANVGGRWRIVQTRDGLPFEWEGEYVTAGEALAALASKKSV
jgi:hypothetical protein